MKSRFKFMMRILLILLFSVTMVVEARMYQWVEPGVDTTQLSGKPPAWYRSAAGGPRIFVFDKGRLVDDTAVAVADDVRQRMRQQAFILAEEDRQQAQEKIAKAQELKSKFKQADIEKADESKPENENDSEVILEEVLFPEESNADEQETTDESIDELRAMIAEWEKAQTESARQALE